MPDSLWLTRYGPEGASSRYRAFQLADGLSAHGWTLRFDPLAEWRGSAPNRVAGVARRIRRLRTIGGDASVLVVQKEPLMPPSLRRLVTGSLRSADAPIVWDIDDAVWLGRRGAEAMAIDMCTIADHVVAGNRLLGEWAERHGAPEVTVVPTCFDPAGAPPASTAAASVDTPRVVWVGSPATAPLVEPFAAVLRNALDSLPGLSIEFVGGPPPAALRGHDRVVATSWSPGSEREALAAADFGLALQDRGEYADHKCGFKIVQYLAYGIVPIASDGPVHRDIVGDHGLLVGTPADSDAVVDRLATPPTFDERSAIVEHHRQGYSVQRAVDGWSGVLAAVDRGRGSTA